MFGLLINKIYEKFYQPKIFTLLLYNIY
jgi:hypothetical protein